MNRLSTHVTPGVHVGPMQFASLSLMNQRVAVLRDFPVSREMDSPTLSTAVFEHLKRVIEVQRIELSAAIMNTPVSGMFVFLSARVTPSAHSARDALHLRRVFRKKFASRFASTMPIVLRANIARRTCADQGAGLTPTALLVKYAVVLGREEPSVNARMGVTSTMTVQLTRNVLVANVATPAYGVTQSAAPTPSVLPSTIWPLADVRRATRNSTVLTTHASWRRQTSPSSSVSKTVIADMAAASMASVGHPSFPKFQFLKVRRSEFLEVKTSK